METKTLLARTVQAACSFGTAFLFFFLLGTYQARAASLYLVPASGSYTVGQTISVGIYASSADQAMNAFSASLSFPASITSASALSKSGSVVSLWSVEPSYSNDTGFATLEGVILNPGYIGTSAKIATMTFRANAEGTAHIRFASGSVLANDGLGTELYDGSTGASFTITAAPLTVKPSSPPAPLTHTPSDAASTTPAVTDASSVPPEAGTDVSPSQVLGETESAAPSVTYVSIPPDVLLKNVLPYAIAAGILVLLLLLLLIRTSFGFWRYRKMAAPFLVKKQLEVSSVSFARAQKHLHQEVDHVLRHKSDSVHRRAVLAELEHLHNETVMGLAAEKSRLETWGKVSS